MLDAIYYILAAGVIPVLINKTTERYKLAWVQKHIRPLWMVVFALFTVYFIHRSEIVRIIMFNFRKYNISISFQFLIIAITGAIVFCVYWLFIGYIFSEPLSELHISADGNMGYPDDTLIGGIKWNKRQAGIRVYLDNDTDRDYNNMDINLNIPKYHISAMGQITNIPNVSFIPVPDIRFGQAFWGTVNPKTGEITNETPLPPSAVSLSSSK
jgi:hypothetical protein